MGKTLVITGTLPDLTAKQATGGIEHAGGKVTGSVSKNTDYLVAGEDPGTKYAKAQELGTEIIDEAGLVELLPTMHRRRSRRPSDAASRRSLDRRDRLHHRVLDAPGAAG